MKKSAEDKAIRQLRLQYDIHVTVTFVIFLLTLLKVIDFSSSGLSIGVVAERYALLITLIAAPLMLKWFSDKMKKSQQKYDSPDAIKLYKSANAIRLFTVTIITLGNILLFAISRNANFMWLTVVLFIVYFFCRPSYPELMSLIETQKSESNDEENA